jgi:hypothetical protein
METIIKETAVSTINTSGVPETKTPEIELLDCGQASKVTKGFSLFLLWELGAPPYDRALIL